MNTSEDLIFKDALEKHRLLQLKKVPKADVHNHSVLGMRFETFKQTFGISPTPPPAKIDGLIKLDEYIHTNLAPYVTTSKQLAMLLETTILEAIDDGVKILETSIDSSWLFFFGSNDDCFNCIEKIRHTYQDRIDFRPELGISKSLTKERLEEALIPCLDSGIFKSVDLYGDESIIDFDRAKNYYLYARSKGLKLKVHVGEFCAPEIVEKAINILDPDEIQHGISIADNNYVADQIKERGIRLNICPSSNIVLGAVAEMKSHPIRKLFEKGIRLSVNTDDLLIFNQGVSEEFLTLYRHNVLGADELNEIRKMGLQ